MLGQTHALSAAGAFLALSFPVSHYVHHLTPLTAAISTLVAAGAGLLPDLDHPSASPARAFGPISQGAARFVAHVSGGHRHATHSFLGLTVAGGLAVAAYIKRVDAHPWKAQSSCEPKGRCRTVGVVWMVMHPWVHRNPGPRTASRCRSGPGQRPGRNRRRPGRRVCGRCA
jgi:hypothetical protein